MEICVLPREKAAWQPAVHHSLIGTSHTAALAAAESSSARMNVLWRVLSLLTLALALMGLARAGNITIVLDPNFPGAYKTYSYTVSGTTYNEYTSPYMASISGGIYGQDSLLYVACFDINIDTYVGQAYTGSLVLPGNNQVQDEVSWLMAQLSNLGGYNAPVSTSGPISMAIWQLELASSLNPTPFVEDPAAQHWITAAQNTVTSGAWTEADADMYPYWVPDSNESAQRFGIEEVYLFNGNAPEPGTFGLIGASLVGLGLLFRKRSPKN